MIYTYGIAALKFCFKTCVTMKFVDDDDDDDTAHAKINTGVAQHRQWAAERTKPHTHGGPSPHTWAQPTHMVGPAQLVCRQYLRRYQSAVSDVNTFHPPRCSSTRPVSSSTVPCNTVMRTSYSLAALCRRQAHQPASMTATASVWAPWLAWLPWLMCLSTAVQQVSSFITCTVSLPVANTFYQQQQGICEKSDGSSTNHRAVQRNKTTYDN